MKCSVVIPCFNEVELTRACLETLLEQTEPPAEILIVDNGSEDATAELGEAFPTLVRVLTQPHNLGFAGGVNAGIRSARGDHVLVLNNDTRCAPDMIEQLRRALEHAPGIGAAAPVSNHVKGDARLPVGDLGRDAEDRRRLAAALADDAVAQDVETLAGLCMLMRRATLDEVGLFDERFGHGNYEDDDLCLRLRLHGYRLVVARRAFLHHEGHATFRALGLDLKEQIAKRLVQFRDKWRDHPAGLATIAALQGDTQLAATAATTARRRCPRWPDADWYIGKHEERSGDADVAVMHLEAFLRRCPEHVDARLALGLAQLRRGDAAAARATLAATLDAHRLSSAQELGLQQRLGRIAYERRLFEDALGHFDAAEAQAHEDGALHNWRGLCLLALGRVEDARRAFARACDLDFALAETNLGICLHRLGDRSAALASFERAVARLPHDPVARANYEACVADVAAASATPAAARS